MLVSSMEGAVGVPMIHSGSFLSTPHSPWRPERSISCQPTLGKAEHVYFFFRFGVGGATESSTESASEELSFDMSDHE